MKQRIVFVLSVLLLASNLFAAGRGEQVDNVVDEPEGFKESVDIDDKKPGKYNFYIEARDKGGNLTVAGPHNLYVDPESDLPIISITNPREDMRIPGNLNIVGTCVDDDAVDYVELMFNGDESNIVRAEGADFWSYYLDTTELPDALHTITIWGVDINGLRGRPKLVKWNLDRKKPVTEISSHELGALVSGKINLKGRVSDGNGIDSLFYSTDNGAIYRPVSLKHNKKDFSASFDFAIDTKQFEDGPAVVWFKAKDRQGTTGLMSWLMYVDNTKPDVQIVYPEVDVAVNGIFSVSGYAQDVVGLESLSWTLDKESGDFDLTIGNPWWAKTFDIRGKKTNSVELSIKAVDVSGNVSIVKRKIPVDQNADLPRVSLNEPEAGQVFFGNDITLNGLVSDDDGVESVFYSLNGAEAVEIPCTGSFQLKLSDVPFGQHNLQVWAKDIYEVIGPKVEVKGIVVAGDAPALRLSSLNTGGTGKAGSGESQEYLSGMEINSESSAVLSLEINSGSALKELRYSLGDGEEQTVPIKAKGVAGGTHTQQIPIPFNVGYGQLPLHFTAVDIYDREGQLEEICRITDLSVARGQPQIVFQDARIAEDGSIRLEEHFPFTGYFLGGKVKEARLSRQSNIISLERDGNFFTIVGANEAGTEAAIAVEVTTDKGFTYASKPLSIINPGSVPRLSLDRPGAIVRSAGEARQAISIAGSIVANLPVSAVQWKAFAPGSSEAIKTGRISPSGKAFTLELAAGDLPYGALIIEFSAATDGESGYAFKALYREDPSYDRSERDPKAKIAPPQVSWIEAGNIYYVINYTENLDAFALSGLLGTADTAENIPWAGAISRENLAVGNNTLGLSIIEKTEKKENKWNFSYKTVKAPPPAAIRLESIADKAWKAGLLVEIPYSTKDRSVAVAIVDSQSPVSNATWTLGERGGLKSSVKKLPDGSQELRLELPADLPADRTTIAVDVMFKDAPALRAQGEFVIVRPTDNININTKEGFTWIGQESLADSSILLDHSTALVGYYNGLPLAKARIAEPTEGLAVRVADGRVLLTASKDGRYSDIALELTDSEGWVYTTAPFNFLVDDAAPALSLAKELDGTWVQGSVNLEVLVSDNNKISRLDYSLDLGQNWKPLADRNQKIDVSTLEDGVIGMAVRAIDEAGRESSIGFSIHKDTQAPQAKIIVPVEDARVNGEILMAIAVEDAGKIIKSEYVGLEGQRVPLEASLFNAFMIGTKEIPLVDGMSFYFEDASGNSFVLDSFPFIIDQEMDLPVVEVNLPEDNEVITTDFVISGIIYDDDKPARVWYSIDDGEEIAVDCENAYSIPIELHSLLDNEHEVRVTAEDIYGVRGHSVLRKFRVSLEEPKASVSLPRFDQTVSGVVHIEGLASDKNDIEKVAVSLDNGNSFNDATGTTEWSYRFDSKILKDGTHVVFIKVWDKYGIEGLYSSLMNVDNTPPNVVLEYPHDGMTTVGPLHISGQATDTISLEGITLNLRSLEGVEIPEHLASISLEPDSILTYDMDISMLPDGLYNLDVWAIDAAENVTRLSRNLRLAKENQINFVEILYPLDGEYVQGNFNLYGYVGGPDSASSASLLIDGSAVETTEISNTGFFCFNLDEETLATGRHRFVVRSNFTGSQLVDSIERTLEYNTAGPWITVDSLAMGDYAFERPWLTGRAGYTLSEADIELMADKAGDKDLKAEIRAKKLSKVEVSFDNGKSFKEVDLGKYWKYRLETQDMTEGMHYLVLRASMQNGEVAVTRMLIQIDKTPPTIRLISPEMGGRYNQEMEFTALVNDDIELGEVRYVLRKGDKASYEVPGFIQGLYFEGHFWGGTLWDVGLGLTFFDDNVKLQVQYGQFTEDQWAMFSDEPMRYGGDVFGAKLLANIFYMPFSYFLGPDWAWLSASLALGANYSYFTITQSGTGQMMSAVLAQLEFPRVTIPKRNMLRTFSLYTEFQLWFIPTDVDTSEIQVDTLVPHITAGIRVNLF